MVLIVVFSVYQGNVKAQTLSLDSCKTLALRNNKKIIEANYEIQASTEVKKNAFTNYFPKVSANAFSMKSQDYLIQLSPEVGLDYLNLASIMVAQPVFTGGRIYNGNRLATIGTEINKLKQSLTTKEVLAKTEELYWNIIALNEKKKTLESYDKLLDTLLKDVTIATKAGLVQRNDLLKVQLKKNEIALNKLKLKNGISLSKKALCQHIGLPYNESINIETRMESIALQKPLFADAVKAVTKRDEYQMLNTAVKASELQKKMIIGENLPQLSIGAFGFYQDAMKQTGTNAIGFVSLSIPLTDWWGGSHKIKEQQIKTNEAQNKLQETSELLVLQINQAQNDLDETFFQIGNAQKSVEQAGENLKVTNDNYKACVSTMSDLLEAQSTYQQALDNLTEAKCNYQIKSVKYQQAIGAY